MEVRRSGLWAPGYTLFAVLFATDGGFSGAKDKTKLD